MYTGFPELGILGGETFWTRQILLNRQTPALHAAFAAVLGTNHLLFNHDPVWNAETSERTSRMIDLDRLQSSSSFRSIRENVSRRITCDDSRPSKSSCHSHSQETPHGEYRSRNRSDPIGQGTIRTRSLRERLCVVLLDVVFFDATKWVCLSKQVSDACLLLSRVYFSTVMIHEYQVRCLCIQPVTGDPHPCDEKKYSQFEESILSVDDRCKCLSINTMNHSQNNTD